MTRGQIRRKAAVVDRVLAAAYGLKIQKHKTDPTTELIVTVLSQNTNDSNRDRAFQSLRRKFPTWGDVARAKPSALADAIRVGGLANIKSLRIIRILKQIGASSAAYSLSFLERMSDKEAWDFLTKFDGVGPKTAACVLLFSLGRKAMPVDTHVHRVGVRLGLIPKSYNAEKAHEWFFALNLAVSIYQLHLNLIQHGRVLCRSQNPRCQLCPLTRFCLWYKCLL